MYIILLTAKFRLPKHHRINQTHTKAISLALIIPKMINKYRIVLALRLPQHFE